MSKRKIALVINIIILILEVIGFGKSLFVDHGIMVEYYTNDSNIIALISSFLFIIFYKKDLEIVKDIRFVATCCLTVTFLVVIFILCPMWDFNYKYLMFTDNFLIFHTIVPVLSIISYLVFEKESNKNYLCPIFTIIYGIVLVILNLLRLVDGPYPFLKINSQAPIASVIWATALILGTYFVSIILNYFNKKIQGAKN